MPTSSQAICGSLIGTAVGDALGLPYENLSPRRAQRLLGEPHRYRFVIGRGMVSDDAEHACMAAQSLIAAGDDVERFSKRLARSLRFWLALAPMGAGGATIRACLKLWIGFSPATSGVFSAGNGPAMRSAILGAAIDDLAQLKAFVRASTRITHTDPKAEWGALAVALAARQAARHDDAGQRFRQTLADAISEPAAAEFHDLIARAIDSAGRGELTVEFARSLGLDKGVTGYIFHSVPISIHAWLRHPQDFREAVVGVIRCGGDADSTAATVGGILGARVGVDGIPHDWRNGLCEWPRTVSWIESLGVELAKSRQSQAPSQPPRLNLLAQLLRNGAFATIIVAHVFRRLLPPY